MTLLALHGALGAAFQLAPLRDALNTEDIHLLDFEGHGGQSLPDHPLCIEGFAAQVQAYLDEHALEKIDIFGYSMGGYVALYLAAHNPSRIGRIFTLATKFDWSPDTARQEIKFLDPDIILAKVPVYAQSLQALHGDKWRDLLNATADMMLAMGDQPPLSYSMLADVNHPVRVSIGDRDRMVSMEETIRLYQALPDGEFQVFPGTPHPIDQMDSTLLAEAINRFFS